MKAKPKTKTGKLAKPKPKRLAVKPSADKGATLEMLKIVDKADRRRMVAEGIGKRQATAMSLSERFVREGQVSIDGMSSSEKIIYYRISHDVIGISPDATFAMIDDEANIIANDDVRLKRLLEMSNAKHREAGYGEDESWPEDKRPVEIQALFNAYWMRLGQLKVAILRQHEEVEMADLLESDPDAYDARVENGVKEMQEFIARRKKEKEAGR